VKTVPFSKLSEINQKVIRGVREAINDIYEPGRVYIARLESIEPPIRVEVWSEKLEDFLERPDLKRVPEDLLAQLRAPWPRDHYYMIYSVAKTMHLGCFPVENDARKVN
jgi:hypothetical protein